MDTAFAEIEAVAAGKKVAEKVEPEAKAMMMSKILEQYHKMDFETYSRTALKIQTTDGRTARFELNEVQLLLESIINNIREQGRLVRLIILKARREGISTWATGRFFHQVATKKNRYATIVAHESEASDFLFQMAKRYYDNLPEVVKPRQELNNKSELYFNAPKGKGLDSAFKVGAAGKKDFGSGQMIHCLHLSEVAKWAAHLTKDLLISLLQTVPPEQNSEVIFESTAKGRTGEFYRRFTESRHQYDIYLSPEGETKFKCEINRQANPENEYSAIFIPWFVFDKYQKEAPSDFKRTAYEEEMVELYGVTDRHLTWRRWAIENQCGGDEDMFKQEYPSNAIEAFVTSGNAIFNVEKCIKLAKECDEPIAVYDCLVDSGQWVSSDMRTGVLSVWEEPKRGKKYIVGADVAEGLEHGDYSVADVIDWVSGEQVAQWHGHVDADTFGSILYWIGVRYNNALIACEVNNHGHTPNLELAQREYENIYIQELPDTGGRVAKKYGWPTNSKTKPMMINTLIKVFRECPGNIRCAYTFDELSTFVREEDGKMGASVGCYDDRVISMGIAQQVREQDPIASSYRVSPLLRKRPTTLSNSDAVWLASVGG